MAITIEEMRARNRGKVRPTEEFEVEDGYTLTIGGVASFGAMKMRGAEVQDLMKALTAFPLKDADGNVVPVDDETWEMAVIVACSVRDPQMTIKDALEFSIAYPFQFGALARRVVQINANAVESAVDEAEQRLGLDPPTPPPSE